MYALGEAAHEVAEGNPGEHQRAWPPGVAHHRNGTATWRCALTMVVQGWPGCTPLRCRRRVGPTACTTSPAAATAAATATPPHPARPGRRTKKRRRRWSGRTRWGSGGESSRGGRGPRRGGRYDLKSLLELLHDEVVTDLQEGGKGR